MTFVYSLMTEQPYLLIFKMPQGDAPLNAVRLRVVKLLGHLGGKLNRNLVTGKAVKEPLKLD